MSDLQCPATFVLVRDGDREPARDVARSLRHRRVAHVYTSDLPTAVTTAAVMAEELDVPVREQAELRELGPDAESDADAVTRLATVLSEIADEHRGETLLVVSHRSILSLALPSLARNVPARYSDARPLPPCGAVEMRVDADGWVMDSWLGEALGAAD